ncbi:33121_t:CDS:2 [Racocetra persica]|uniref:33121_t:CDS:1 n=1 Tax=Racocetra persica TaxID=160502 RepID=A0ACA9S2F0_9GLOM|nr:33121_t:CDS:2 [Racocetra persica]
MSSLLDAISDEELQKENIDFEISHRIIVYISEGDGTVNIEIFSTLDLIKIVYSHKALHPRPRHVATTLEVKTFIKDNIEFPVPEIWRQIRENFIKGYENLTVQQTYYWWSIESRKKYCRDSDPLLSAKHLLEELNQEIIVDNLNSSTPALGFLTLLFNRLIYNKFDAIAIDATYGMNSLACELYSVIGIIDSTGFPLSYLLITAGRNRNITEILFQWMKALKEQH